MPEVYAIVTMSGVNLLSIEYQYLLGYMDGGGTKTYSPGSLEVRSTYVSIVLFQGAYVWIKFRNVASSKRGGYRRPVSDKLLGTIKPSDKIEVRYTPPRESGNHNHIYLGLCATHEEAEIKKKIASFYYGRNTGRLDFDDGQYFLIPSMPTEQEQGLSVAEKRAWVKHKVREVYEDIKGLRANIHASIVPLDEQINASRHSPRPVEQFEPASERPSVTFDPEFCVEEYLTLPEDIDANFCKSLEESLDSSEGMSDLPNSEPQQHLQDNHVQDFGIDMTFDNQCQYSSLDTEPLGTSYSAWGSESILNFVHESCEVAVNPNDMGGMMKEGAQQNFQAVSEFPTMSPIFTLQQHSDAMALLSDMVTPSTINLCPKHSTSDLIALKVINLLEQQIKDKDKRIVELEREVERLRGTSQY